MSNDTTTPAVVQDTTAVKSKSSKSYNGLYRRNNRKPKTEGEISSVENSKETQEDVVESNPPQEPKKTVAPKKTSSKTTPSKLVVKKKKITENEDVAQKATIVAEKATDSNAEENIHTEAEVEKNENSPQTKHKQHKQHKEIKEVEEPPTVSVRSPFHELLYLIRQKNSNNHPAFFLELDNVLKKMSFKEIEESNLSLFGFACLYDREAIFKKMCEKFPEEITQPDLERTLKICLNKREETITNLLSIYSNKFVPEPDFIEQLFISMSISSYREINNLAILNWIAPFASDSNMETFWNSCIEHRNSSLMLASLQNKKFKEYLSSNLNKFFNGLKLIGRDYSIVRALDKDYEKFTTTVESVFIEKKAYLSNDNEQMQHLKQNMASSIEGGTKGPTVLVKKKSSDSSE